VAEELRLNQSNVSRRLKSGIEALRDRLGKLGVAVPVAILAALLTENAARAAPPALMAALGKMAIAGIGEATGASSKAGMLGFGTLKMKAAGIAIVAALAVAGGLIARGRPQPDAAVSTPSQILPSLSEPAGPSEQKISVSWHGVGLTQALNDLYSLAGLRSAHTSGLDNGLVLTLDLRDSPVSEVVGKLADTGGLAYHRDQDLAFFWDPRDAEVRRQLRSQLVTFSLLEETPCLEAFRFLSVVSQIDIAVALEGSRDHRVAPCLSVWSMPVGEAIQWVTKHSGLTYALRGGAIVVSTPDRIDTAFPPPERGREDRLRRITSPRVLAVLDDALALDQEDSHRITSEILDPMVASGKFVSPTTSLGWQTPGDTNDMLALSYLSKVTRQRDRFIRHGTLRVVGPVAYRDGDKRAMALVQQALSDVDEEVRRKAAVSLPETGRDSLRLLENRLSDVFEYTRQQAAGVLPILDREVGLHYVERLLARKNGEVDTDPLWPGERMLAASMLATIRRDRAVPLAKKMLTDEHKRVRGSAVYALCVHEGERALPLAAQALRDPEEDVRSVAASGLAVIGGEKVLPLLEQASCDSSEWVRCSAIRALGRVGGEGAIALVEKAQKDDSYHVRKRAAEALVEIGTERALALFENSLRDTDPEVVEYALKRLAEARSPAALATMVKVVETRGSDVLGRTWNLKLLKEPRREPERGLDAF